MSQAFLCALQIKSDFNKIKAQDFKDQAQRLKREYKKADSIRLFLDTLYQPKNSYEYSIDDSVTVCRCENQSLKAINQSIVQGALSLGKIKAFTRSSMGMCQGRFCSLSISQLLQHKYGVNEEKSLYNKIRMPVKPMSFKELSHIQS